MEIIKNGKVFTKNFTFEKADIILDKGEIEVQKIKNISTDKKNNAINLIVERIVKINGNS